MIWFLGADFYSSVWATGELAASSCKPFSEGSQGMLCFFFCFSEKYHQFMWAFRIWHKSTEMTIIVAQNKAKLSVPTYTFAAVSRYLLKNWFQQESLCPVDGCSSVYPNSFPELSSMQGHTFPGFADQTFSSVDINRLCPARWRGALEEFQLQTAPLFSAFEYHQGNR